MAIVNRKIYALIRTSQENAAKINEIIDGVFANGEDRTMQRGLAAINALKAIRQINEKFRCDFGTVNPGWHPIYRRSTGGQPAPIDDSSLDFDIEEG